MTSGWPDVPAATSAGLKVRDQLDYVVWVSEAIEPLGFHGGTELDAWRRRVQTAYTALVDAMAPGHGDPLPPDVPPTQRPGAWPDVPSAAIPGMTVRHQLVVVRSIASSSRGNRVFPQSPAAVAAWTARVQAAYDAMDHGPALAMPDAARTAPPAPAPGTASPKGARRHAGKAGKTTSRAPRTKGGAARRAAARTKPRATGKPKRRK